MKSHGKIEYQYQEDALPDIWLITKLNPKEFVSSVRQILKGEKGYKNEIVSMAEADEPTKIISIMPDRNTRHKGFFWQFIIRDKQSNRVDVEMRASDWGWDSKDFDTYVAACKSYVQPFVKKYAGRLGTSGRISIEKKASLEPNLSHPIRERLESFINLANTSALHPLDWGRFYSFIRYCHRTRAKVSSEDVKRILWKSGFSPGYANSIGDVFHHGRELLKN